ncbi:hypothetical protein C4D60_Mb03t14580 [Musa balbisiana]|uniref:O-fucosyltransferase family protein n=1 Tax=Musa balbisiana TaxID=52838 RepID=A0A4S8J9W1_MUSBA|nr:hypothetical protein C4D60_Mb03t14580 [Musa balbisiana]
MRLPRRRHHPLRCPIPAASAVSLLSTAVAVLLLALALLSYLAPPPFLDHPSVSGHRLRHSDPSPVRKPKISHDAAVRRDATTGETFRVPHGGGSSKNGLWGSKLSKYYVGCSNASIKFPAAEAVTRRDSNFGDIFDVNWFISFLSKDVKIIKELPKKGGKPFRGPYTMRVPRKCTPRCYQNRVLPVLLKKHVVQLTKFDYRLANKLEADLQKLRCRVNYHALKFTHPIQDMGDKLIHRMKEKGKHFIALHLRYEPDMLAFSGCYYGGGEKERKELGAIRKRWKTLHISNPDKARRQGRCPLTPEEVGLMLRALGYGSDVHIYVASGEIYGGDESLAPLKALFPNFHSKETLASKEELEPFSLFSSRMAALDFIVCDGSDAFVANNNGNMARMLTGRRRYFGHKRTLRPNAKKLYSLFLNRANMTWEQFSLKVYSYQRGFLGEPKEVRPGRGEFHENPSACICETTKAMRGKHSGSLSQTNGDDQHGKSNRGHSISEPTYNHTDEEPDWSDMDYGEYTPLSKSLSNSTDMDYNPFIRPEDSELEDFLSD